MEQYDNNNDATPINTKAMAHDTMAKRTFAIIKQQFDKTCHRNPFNNKITTRMIKSKRKLMNSMVNEINTNIDQLKTSGEDPVLLSQFNKMLNDLKQYDKPDQTIEEQLSDLKVNYNSMGVMDMQWDINMNDTYINSYTLILAPSKGGKSVLVNQLIFELPQSFDKVCLFMGKDSYMNKCPKTLEHICKRAGLKVQWINTDNIDTIEFNENEDTCYNDLNADSSSKYVYKNTMYGSVFILDDLYTCRNPNIVNFIDEMAVKGRHMKVNSFVCYQGFTKLSNKIVDNATRVFIHQSFIEREDLWRKLKMPPPDNLHDVINDIHSGYGTRWYYIDDCYLTPYVPYSFATPGQVIDKMKAKLPKPLKNEATRKEFEEKQKQVDKLRKQLGIKDSLQSLLTGSTDDTATNSTKPKTVLLTDPKDAHEVTQKQRSQEYDIPSKSRFGDKRVRNIRAKYKI